MTTQHWGKKRISGSGEAAATDPSICLREGVIPNEVRNLKNLIRRSLSLVEMLPGKKIDIELSFNISYGFISF
jgi:hypothetical protein